MSSHQESRHLCNKSLVVQANFLRRPTGKDILFAHSLAFWNVRRHVCLEKQRQQVPLLEPPISFLFQRCFTIIQKLSPNPVHCYFGLGTGSVAFDRLGNTIEPVAHRAKDAKEALTTRKLNFPNKALKMRITDMAGRELNMVLKASFSSFLSPCNELNL